MDYVLSVSVFCFSRFWVLSGSTSIIVSLAMSKQFFSILLLEFSTVVQLRFLDGGAFASAYHSRLRYDIVKMKYRHLTAN